MKNIIDICKDFGFEVPAEQQADFNKAVAENYKTVAEHDKKLGKIEAERDAQKERADAAEETLKAFDGIDPAKIQSELDTWKQKAENAEKEYSDKLYQRDYEDAIKAALTEYEFTSEAAKKAIYSEVSGAGLKMKDGKLLGLGDLMKQLQEADASAFVDKQQKEQEQTKARFTAPNNGGNRSDVTLATEIRNIKDPAERQSRIAQLLRTQKGIDK